MATRERVALDVRGLKPFTALTGVRQFRKDVLRVGRWVHPATGEILDFTPDFLARLVEGTTHWIALGNKVWFPAGHSTDPRDNMGFWSRFELQGDCVFGVLEVEDDEIASKVGTTIQDVSAGIWWDARASTGESFEAVIEHVCGTPCPVIPDQKNFVRLAREVTDVEKKTALAAESGGLDLASAIKVLLGLPAETDEAALIDAVRARCLELDTDDDDDDKIPAAPEELATLSREVEALKSENQRIRSRAAQEKVDMARRRSVEIGCPLEEDVRKDALALLERGDDASTRLADRLLELALRPSAPVGKTLPNPGTNLEERAELDRHAALERAYVSQGLSVEKDAKGRILRVTRPEPVKK
jgi:hypothetical protein